MGDLSAHFSRHEFRCHDDHDNPCPYCGGKVDIDPRLIDALELIREHSDIPMQITSGHRCERRNAEVGGKPDSAHLQGLAADFWVSGNHDRFKFLEAIIWTEASVRIGLGRDFIHIDVDLTKPQEVAWPY